MSKHKKSRTYESKKGGKTGWQRNGCASTIIWALKDIQDSYKPKKPLRLDFGRGRLL